MVLRYGREHERVLTKFIKSHYSPENGFLFEERLFDFLYESIIPDENNLNAELYLYFNGDEVNGATRVLHIPEEAKEQAQADMMLTVYANSYGAVSEMLDMPLLKGKNVQISGCGMYTYQFLTERFGDLADKPYVISYSLNTEAYKSIDFARCDIREMPLPPEWDSENNYKFGLFAEDTAVSSSFIRGIPKHPPPGRRKMWAITGLNTVREHRQRGYASTLTAYLINFIMERGSVPIYWHDHDNEASRRNALKCGFAEISIRCDYNVKGLD